MKADELLKYKPFSLEEEEKQVLFKEAIAETLAHHYEGNELFRQYCVKNGFDPRNGISSLGDIPYIPIQLYKKCSFLTVKEEEIVDIRKSSSTSTGTPSVVHRDAITMERYRISRNMIFDDFIDDRNKTHICIGEDPEFNKGASRNLINSLIAERSGSAETYYLIKDKEDKFKVDLDMFLGLLEEARQKDKPVGLIFGGTAIIYLFLIKPLLERGVKLDYSGYIAHGGGWKKLQDQQVSKEIFNRDLRNVLNCPTSHIVDMYGFAEANSMFIDCEAGYKHVPVWNEVIIRDPLNMKPVGKGERGIVQILDALPHSYAGASLLTDDIGYISTEKHCPCGRKGSAFKVLRRALGSEAKGCGDMMVDKMK